MMPDETYASWLTKQQAAEKIGCSTKTVEKLAADRKLQQAFRRSPAGAKVAVYHPEDVAHEAATRNPNPEAFEVPARGIPLKALRDMEERRIVEGKSIALITPRQDAIEQLLAILPYANAILSRAASENSQKCPTRITEKVYLTMAEAAEYSGLPPIEILRAIDSGLVLARKTGRGWRFNRKSLEGL
jgi:excisionase family DNA binding protein